MGGAWQRTLGVDQRRCEGGSLGYELGQNPRDRNG